MSNLAVKGIIAISAMAKLAKALEKPNAEIILYKVDGPTFSRITKLVFDGYEKNKATILASEWEALAVSSSGFITSTYGDPSNWIMPYHLYSAKLIASDIISEGVSWLNRQMVQTLTSSMIGVHESTKILWDADTPR